MASKEGRFFLVVKYVTLTNLGQNPSPMGSASFSEVGVVSYLIRRKKNQQRVHNR